MDVIHAAIMRGDVKTVRALVEEERDLLYLDDWQARTPLVLSVIASSLPLVRFFVEEGHASVDEPTAPDGNTALFYACRDGLADIAAYLLAKGADPFQRNRNGTTLFMIAAASAPSPPVGGSKSGKEIRSACAVVGCLVDAINARGEGACEKLEDILNAKNRNGKVALTLACEREARDVVPVLVAAGANPFFHLPDNNDDSVEDDDASKSFPPCVKKGVDDEEDQWCCVHVALQEPERIHYFEKLRFMSETAHVQEQLLQQQEEEEKEQQQHEKCLAAAPAALKNRVANKKDLPRVTVHCCTTEAKDDDDDKEKLLREVARHVLLEGGLKPELFVEWMGLLVRKWHYDGC